MLRISCTSVVLAVVAYGLAVLGMVALPIRVEASELPNATLKLRGGIIDVEFAEGNFDLPRKAFLDRVTEAANAVSTYYGQFPMPRYRMLIVPIAGRRGVLTGTTWGYGGAHSRILVGEHTTIADLNEDWIMTHEMVHLAFPGVEREHHWIEEGIATYVEPLARSWVGDYSAKKVWKDLVLGLPQGMPSTGDAGLDRTHTWGRTYWGGAMFCLLADVEIRKRTNNNRGLIDALRGILAASGGIESEWPLNRAIKAGDNAVGVPVLEELYARVSLTPMSPNLAAMWNCLGVETKGRDVTLNDSAQQARIRHAISALPANAPKN